MVNLSEAETELLQLHYETAKYCTTSALNSHPITLLTLFKPLLNNCISSIFVNTDNRMMSSM